MSAAHVPLFERLTRLLDPLDPAELHGLLCGLLCANPRLTATAGWPWRANWLSAELTEPVCGLLAKLLEFAAQLERR